MAYQLNQLGGALAAQLSEIVSGGDAHVQMPDNTFVTFCSPGIPMKPEMFAFAADGFGSGKDAEAEKQMLNAAYAWSQMADFVPTVTEPVALHREDGVYRPNGAIRMSDMYGEILRFSKVVQTPLTKKQKAKLARYRNLMQVMVTKKDLITGKKQQVPDDGPVVKAYNAYQANYRKAALTYNAKRIAAQTATGPDGKAAVLDWAANADLYREDVKSAMDQWVANGYKNEVEAIRAYIDQVTRRDMTLWKQGLVERFDEAVVNGLAPGQHYRFTSVLPGDFMTSDGWTQFSVSHSQVDTHEHDSSSGWRAGAGLSWGLWSAGADASGSSTTRDASTQVSTFGLKLELAQVLIDRNWFYPEWFINRGWTLRPGEGWFYPDMPSDGQDPPTGQLIGYPTMALFARDIEITSSEFVSAYKEASSSLSAGGSIGWGPICLSGGYDHKDHDLQTSISADGSKLTVKGNQLLAFVNHLIPKSPDPLPQIPQDRFV